MHDAVWFEVHGIPALVVASSEFVEAAEVQSRALGLAGARRLFVPHPIQDATESEMNARADQLLPQLISLLEGD